MYSLLSFFLYVVFQVSDIEAACQADEVQWQTSCYYFGSVIESPHMAKAACQARGSHLVSISSQQENAFINAQAKAHNSLAVSYVIGANNEAGSWKWDDGTPFSYTNWNVGQPDNYFSLEHCAIIYRPAGLLSQDYLWADVNCDVPAEFFICEKSVEGGGTPVVG